MDDPKETAKWQAASHPHLTERKPDELFAADAAKRYERLHQDLWRRIVRLHGTIRTLEQLEEFPFDRVYGPHDMEFWRLVVDNFLDIACLLLHGLVSDTGEDVLTIRSFKNMIVKEQWVDQRMRDLFVSTWRERRLGKDLESVAARVKRLRDGRIAHRLIDRQSGGPKQSLPGLGLKDLRLLFDAVHALFGALSFGSAYATLAGDLMPGTVGGKRTRTCLDEVLDAVLRSSYFVNEPERRHPWWPDLRGHLAPEALQVMNDLRKRVGLPEA